MKKLFLALMMLCGTMATYAQHAVGSFTLQPKVGMNIADLTKFDDTDARIGLAVGAELEYQATDMLSISAGALYSMQGCKYEYYAGNKTTLKADYINIPILANVYVVKGLAVKLGIQPGFNVNSECKISNGNSSTTTDVDAKSVDFSIPVGLSYEYSNVVLDARYNWGLTKVYDGYDAKNSVFQITLGYKFDL